MKITVWYHNGTEDPPQAWTDFASRAGAEEYIARQRPRDGESYFIKEPASREETK